MIAIEFICRMCACIHYIIIVALTLIEKYTVLIFSLRKLKMNL